MEKKTMRGLLRTSSTGSKTWAGLVVDGQEVPPELVETQVEVLDSGDGSYWVLAHPEPLRYLSEEDLKSEASLEAIRRIRAKLTPDEQKLLGLQPDSD